MTKAERIRDCQALIDRFLVDIAAGTLSSIISHSPPEGQADLWRYGRSVWEKVVDERTNP
jgi:hypothetical protein